MIGVQFCPVRGDEGPRIEKYVLADAAKQPETGQPGNRIGGAQKNRVSRHAAAQQSDFFPKSTHRIFDDRIQRLRSGTKPLRPPRIEIDQAGFTPGANRFQFPVKRMGNSAFINGNRLSGSQSLSQPLRQRRLFSVFDQNDIAVFKKLFALQIITAIGTKKNLFRRQNHRSSRTAEAK